MIWVSSWDRSLFWQWCQEHDILCEFMGTETPPGDPAGNRYTSIDIWYIGCEQDRTLATLRWS